MPFRLEVVLGSEAERGPPPVDAEPARPRSGDARRKVAERMLRSRRRTARGRVGVVPLLFIGDYELFPVSRAACYPHSSRDASSS